MNVYEMYDESLKNDTTHEMYRTILAAAENKVVSYAASELTDFELCALIDGMAEFSEWDVPVDYWDIADGGKLIDQNYELSTEYVTRTLCCLIDTSAPREEIEKWYALYDYYTWDYWRGAGSSLSEAEEKIFSWYESQAVSPEVFAEGLSAQDIHSLLDAARDLPNHDLPLDENDSEWSKYQIISQYIRTALCYHLDQKDSWDEIKKWYSLNYIFNY